MKNTDIIEKLRTAVNHSVPDIFDSILSDCEEQNGRVVHMNTQFTKKSSLIKSLGIVAAALFIFVAGATGYSIVGSNTVESVIFFDVNPSLEIMVNKNEKVLSVTPLNDRAEVVIGDMDFKDADLDIAVNALVGSMLRNGYIDDVKNSILISVESKNDVKGAALQTKLSKEISELLRADSIEGAILTQTLTDDDELKALAKRNAISYGKAQLVSQLLTSNPKYKFEELAGLPINDLNLLVESNQLKLRNTYSTGKASDKSYIGASHAAKIAFMHAGVNSANVNDLEAELEFDNGRFVYEIEFNTGIMKYDFEIDAMTGAILSCTHDSSDNDDDGDDSDDDYDDDDGDDSDDDYDDDDDVAVPIQSGNTFPGTTKPETARSETKQPSETRMSASDARRTVINKFGGIVQKIEYTYDETNPLYKGEALKDGCKVAFELNARTKSFTKWDSEDDDSWDDFADVLPEMITMNQAASSVINKSGKSNTFVQKIDFLWDDSEPIYQGEAFNNGIKYSFEIYAYGGGFKKWDSSTGDETWKEKYYNVQ